LIILECAQKDLTTILLNETMLGLTILGAQEDSKVTKSRGQKFKGRRRKLRTKKHLVFKIELDTKLVID
jgi:hypothetical protein